MLFFGFVLIKIGALHLVVLLVEKEEIVLCRNRKMVVPNTRS